MTTTQPHDETRVLRNWRARPLLSTSQWRELYADLHPIYAQACGSKLGDEVLRDYPEFFLRHVVETTPSNPAQEGWLRELMREFIEERASTDKPGWSLPAPGILRQPPLEQVERQLFRVADRFLFESAARMNSGASAESIGLEPELVARVRRMLEDVPGGARDAGPVVAELPSTLAGCLLRKSVAAEALSAVSRPRSGQIVTIETLTGPEGAIDEDIARPLCALIDRPTHTPDVFWGWMVGAETDYASDADFVLADVDEPRDPIAATVQLWNPVRVYWPTVARVVGQLAPQRLGALRAFAADFLSGGGNLSEGTPVADAPDRFMARRTDSGELVITGLALENGPDVRALYQTMYISAADVLMQPALQAEAAWAAEQRASWLDTAEVQAQGLYLFVARDRHDPTHTLQLVFEAPGSDDLLVLMQRHGQVRSDAPLIINHQRIEFRGGLARPSAEQLVELARKLRLPAPFIDWPAASADLARSNGVTGASTQQTLSELLELAKKLAKASFEVFEFAFAHLSRPGLQAATRGGRAPAEESPVAIAGMDFAAPDGLALRLLLPPAAEPILTVEVSLNGQIVSPPKVSSWVEPGEVLRIEGLTPDPAWKASARLRSGHLRIDLNH